jgi:integrase
VWFLFPPSDESVCPLKRQIEIIVGARCSRRAMAILPAFLLARGREEEARDTRQRSPIILPCRRQRVGDVKTIYSGRTISIDSQMLAVLKGWKQTTQFASETDWIFASPVQLGRLPVSYPRVWLMFQKAAEHSGIGKLGTHSLRHSYRSWLDAVGTPVAVQQKLMRHADIRTTFNIYGDVVTNEMAQAHSKVVRLAIPTTM